MRDTMLKKSEERLASDLVPKIVAAELEAKVPLIYDRYSGSMKITTHLDHISHCKTSWSNGWTY